MEQLEFLSQTELLDRLPPISKAPILEKLAILGLSRFRNEYAVETPVDEQGIVDHHEFMQLMNTLVSSDYKWKAPFFDEHHSHWYDHRYNTSFQPDQALAIEFRNLPIHKLWVPRQFHDFVHIVTMPTDAPETTVMRDSVKSFRRRNYIYKISNQAIDLRMRSERAKEYATPGGGMILMDPTTNRASRDPLVLEKRREEFIRYIEKNHRKGLLDLSKLTSLELQDVESIADLLPVISAMMSEGLIRQKGRVALRVDIPFERAA